MPQIITEEQVRKALLENYPESKEILQNEDKLEKLFQRLEKKLKIIPVVGGTLSEIPMMASLIKSYVQGEYKDIPIGTIVAIVSALVYFVSPVDLIPDCLPVVGHLDDAAVIAACLKLVDSDLQEYRIWRERNGIIFDIPDFDTNVPVKKGSSKKNR